MAFSFLKKKKNSKDDRYQTLTIKEVVDVAKDAVNVVFEKPDEFDYKPGQFITIIDKVKGQKIRRAYSLCTTPYEDVNPAVTVKRVPGGAMSNHINDTFKTGALVETMEPMGMFTTDYSSDKKRKAVFFGGGSGITPLMAILRSILLKEPLSEVVLVYGNRSKEYIIFDELIKSLAEKYAERFRVIHILEEGESDYTGRPSEEMLLGICRSIELDSNTECFICGPQPMMDLVSEVLPKAGADEAKVMMESFEAGKTSPKDVAESKSAASKVTILLDGEEHEIAVKSNEVILEEALNNDLDMPYSCQSGLCTACRGRCLEGKASVDDAEGLSQAEIDEGFVLTCVAKPLTDSIKIEMG